MVSQRRDTATALANSAVAIWGGSSVGKSVRQNKARVVYISQ